MKQGRTIQQLAAEVDRQQAAKRDFVADSRQLELVPAGGKGTSDILRVADVGAFNVLDTCHDQLANFTGIPRKYYDRLRATQPELYAQNVNTWLREEPSPRLVRTLDGSARALLSNRYRRLDNFDLMKNVLPEIAIPNLRVVSSEITERRLYLKVTATDIQAEVKKGDVVQSGVIVSNSEIGQGRIKVYPYITRLVCTNGMTVDTMGVARTHVGRALDSEDNAYEIFSDEALAAEDNAFWLMVRDLVRASFSRETFEKIVDQFRTSAEIEIRKPLAAVKELSKKIGLTEDESESCLNNLLTGGDLSAWGLANAVTALSDDATSYDRASDLEAAGWKVLELPATDWKRLNEAA